MALAVAPSETQEIPPNQSLYIQNLNDKLQKNDLKRELYMLFSAHGAVLDVTAVKSAKMRGQAHVLFRDVQTATQAMRVCQGVDFFGREMKISYSKSRSKTLSKLTGTFYDEQTEATAPAPAKAQMPAGIAGPPPGISGPPPGTGGPPAGIARPPPAIFGPPPGVTRPPPAIGGPPPGLPSLPNLPAKPSGGLPPPPASAKAGAENAPSPLGTKRPREESDEENEEEGNSDDEAEMEMSDDD